VIEKLNIKVLLGIFAISFITFVSVVVITVGKNNTDSIVTPEMPTEVLEDPEIITEVVVDGLNHPWDLDFLNKDIMFYTERTGHISGFNLLTKEKWLITKPDDVFVFGEAGMMGIEVDRDFDNNKYIFTCFNTTIEGPIEVHVARWKLSDDMKNVLERKDIIPDLPSNKTGRHSGCRMEMDKNFHLWIGTGDTATDGSIPQYPQSLGGKILRVDRGGKGVSGNLAGEFDNRIFSYGHRNIQGMIVFDEAVNGNYGYSAEHGPGKDDEINEIRQGNFGWDPIPGYNEEVDMTDLEKYPDAIEAVWESGDPTVAISGIELLKGEQWKGWEGSFLAALLKDQQVRLIKFEENGDIREEKVVDVDKRLRAMVQGPDGNIYFSTDNNGNVDQIYRIVPK